MSVFVSDRPMAHNNRILQDLFGRPDDMSQHEDPFPMSSPKKRKLADLMDEDNTEIENQNKRRAVVRSDGAMDQQSTPPGPAARDEKGEHVAMILCSLAPTSTPQDKSPTKAFSVSSMLNDTPVEGQQIQLPPVEQKPHAFSPRSDQPKPQSPVSSIAEEDSDEDGDSSDSGTKDSQAGSRKKKRHRTTPEQLRTLEETYEKEKMPNQELRERLAKKLGMTPRRVQIWFQNKRAKEKRSKPSPRSSLQMHHHQPTNGPIHVNSNEYGQHTATTMFNPYFPSSPDPRFLHNPSPFTQGSLNPPLIPSLFSAAPRPMEQRQFSGLSHDMFGNGNSSSHSDFSIRLPPLLRTPNE